MAGRLELEPLLIRIVGDNSSAIKAMHHVQKEVAKLSNMAMSFGNRMGKASPIRAFENSLFKVQRNAGRKMVREAQRQNRLRQKQAEQDDVRLAKLEMGARKRAVKALQAQKRQAMAQANKDADRILRQMDRDEKFVENARYAWRKALRKQEDRKNANAAKQVRAYHKQMQQDDKNRQKLLDRAMKQEDIRRRGLLKDTLAQRRRDQKAQVDQEKLLGRLAARKQKEYEREQRAHKRSLDKQTREESRAARAAARAREQAREESERRWASRVQTGIYGGAAAAGMMGLAGGALLAGFGASVDEYSKFNLALTESTSIMEVNKAQIGDMTSLIYELSLKGPYAPAQLAKAFYFLASAGLDAKSAMESLNIVQQFSIAGAMHLEEATSLSMNVMSAMGMRTEDVAQNRENLKRITDALVMANIRADATTKQLAQTLIRQAGPAMRLFGKDIEEALAMAMTMADQGDKGVTAGTHMSMMLRHLSMKSVEKAAAFKEYGINVFDEKGNLKHVADIAEEMSNVLGPYTDEARAQVFKKLGFEAKLQQSMFPLLGKAKQFRMYDEVLRKEAPGSRERVMAKQMEAFGNQMKMALNAVTILAIEVGEKLAPAFLGAGSAVVEFTRWFLTLDKSMVAAVATVGVVTGAVLSLGAAVLGTAVAVLTLYSFIGGPALVAVGVIFAAVTALGVALGIAVVQMGGFAHVWEVVSEGAREFWKWLQPVRAAIENITDAVGHVLAQAFDSLLVAASRAWKAVGGDSINWDEVRGYVVEGLIMIEYSLYNLADVSRLVWASMKLTAISGINFITSRWFDMHDAVLRMLSRLPRMSGSAFANASAMMLKSFSSSNKGVLEGQKSMWENMWAMAESGVKMIWSIITGDSEGKKKWRQEFFKSFTRGKNGQDTITTDEHGFLLNDFKRMEEEARLEYEKLKKEIGFDSDKWKNFRDERINTLFGRQVSDIIFDELPGENKAFEELPKQAEQANKRFKEAYQPGTHAMQEKAKLEQALYGSAEFLSRVQARFDEVYASPMSQSSSGRPSQEKSKVETLLEEIAENTEKVKSGAAMLMPAKLGI